MAEKCKECGCKCAHCTQDDEEHSDMHLHVEIEDLRQRLLERDNHIVTMETQFLNEADKFPNGELASIKEEVLMWQEKYSRLYEAHKRVQKVNQNLEDKLLRIVDKCETEKGAFTKDIATLSHRLADANYTIHRLSQDNEKYRNDVNLAIQLLQCKPSNFVGQKYESLPSEVQAKVRTYVAQKRRSSDVMAPDVKSITVPISTFPPTAMVYNVTKPSTEKHSDDDSEESKPPVDVVSAAIMAKVLEDREKERTFAKHCDTCRCHKSILLVDAETQTSLSTSVLCNEHTSKCSQNTDKRADVFKGTDKSTRIKDNQSFVTQPIFQEINENAVSNGKIQFYNNTNCAKPDHSQFASIKDKSVMRNGRSLDSSKEDSRVSVNAKSNLNKKNLVCHCDIPIQTVTSNYAENLNKQGVPQNFGDKSIGRANTDKIKQGRINKNTDSFHDSQSNTNYWNKFESKSTSYNNSLSENSNRYPTGKEQSQIDIINDRLWKNEWTKSKRESNRKDKNSKKQVNNDTEIDVINDRVWRNDRSKVDTCHSNNLTLIEVKNIDNVNDSDCRQMEITTSPSYSSDSVVISTSDPSSSSSDVANAVSGLQTEHNVNKTKSNPQNKIVGSRNCLVRVTPGSKNILLDNAGHYKTVLYTSGSNKPNTALVHLKKASRSCSERSTSTSSDDNSPVLLHDNNQLQRVAEWVQSSARIENSEKSEGKLSKSSENDTRKRQSSSLMYVDEKHLKSKMFDVNQSGSNEMDTREKCSGDLEDISRKSGSSDANVPSRSSDVCSGTQMKEKDLISFDVLSDDETPCLNVNKISSADLDYEVKITKEMEETYLKLAASLDPVTLSLSGSDNTDLTIEKYRQDYKKLHGQRVQDKAGSTT